MKSRTKKRIGDNNGPRPAPASKPWADVLRRLLKNKVAVAGFIVFFIICISCLLAPHLTKWNYSSINTDHVLESPTLSHILGTDNLGRDMFSRLLYGGRMTLRIAFITAALAMVIGGVIGLVAGYFGGRADFIISPILDIIASIPVILLAIVTEAALGWGRGNFMYALVIAAIPQFARLVRATTMNIMGCEYIEAARALGGGHMGIISRHVLHNIAPPLVVRFTGGLADALLTCTIMGYLGIGINPPTPEWGLIVFFAKSYIRMHPRLLITPCVVIVVSIISIGLFGDGLRDAFDPRN